jgi:hypothetical protein
MHDSIHIYKQKKQVYPCTCIHLLNIHLHLKFRFICTSIYVYTYTRMHGLVYMPKNILYIGMMLIPDNNKNNDDKFHVLLLNFLYTYIQTCTWI